MWPQALQMTRDECRGILRRLELESYSHVISVFRAQGGLSDNKAKLLEELRGIFHISQERHRAEARRVANDEQLSTIAEAISGPNTWQEWSREGRRSFPMLPRVAPQTALALIANNVANEVAAENCKLPYPAETAAAVAEEQAAEAREAGSWEGAKREGYVVTDDPFKMPDIPAGPRKNLKRNITDNQMSSSSKKRLISDMSPTKQQQQKQKQYAHITANSASSAPTANASSNIRKLYHNHSNNKLQQQRYFHQQQIQKQKLTAKKTLSAPATTAAGGGATTGGKRQTPARSGRKAQSKAQEQKQQQQMLQQQFTAGYGSKELQNVELSEEFKQNQSQSQSASQPQHIMPQIAASKKDITKNLSKLQLPVSASASATMPSVTSASARIDAQVLATSPVMSGPLPPVLHGKMDKQLISTPVQKFILEDRQPPPQPQSQTQSLQVQPTSASQIMTLPQISAAATKLRAVNTTILPPGTKLTPKKMSGATMLTNTGVGINVLGEHTTQSGALVTASGTGSTSGGAAAQSQVYNIIESNSTAGTSAQVPLTAPTHTPPAIIQLQSNSDAVPPQQPTQGKVLTTKLLPIMLSGSTGASGVVGTGIVTSSANITKIETLNNGATLVTAGGANSTNPMGTTIIKNMPSTLLLSPNQSGNVGATSGTIFSTLGSGTSVFRKPPIIKTANIGMGASNTMGKISSNFNVSTSNTGPQIISSVKLTPAISTTTVATTHTHQQQQQFLQQQLKNVSSTGLRTSVKICQSPNGKVFIQPANVDAGTKVKLQGGLQHKLLPNSLVGATGVTANTNATPPQRIAIQKVQIIPAPLHSPGHLPGTFQTQQPHQSKATTTLTIGNKGNMNMIFMPATGGRTTSGTITLAKGSAAGTVVGNIVGKTQSPQQQQQQQQQMHIQSSQHVQESAKPTNVVVIGATSTALPTAQTLPQTATPLKSPTYTDSSGKIITTTSSTPSLQLDTTQMITEDTPVDILNMPIIVDSGDGTNVSAVGSNIVDSVTVLSSALVESATQQAQSQHQQQQQPTIILGATDWEMELDQATAVAAASKVRPDFSRQSSSSSNRARKSIGEQQHQQLNEKSIDEGAEDAIIIDDSFDDVIVEEQEEMIEAEDQEQQHEKLTYTISNENVGENVGINDLKVVNTREAKSQASAEPPAYAGVIEEEEPIDIIDEEQKQSSKRLQESSKNEISGNTSGDSNFTNVPNTALTTTTAVTESETDAGFDETIVTEIDENTAIEYIEDEQNATVALEDVEEKSESKGVNSTIKRNDLLNSATDTSKVALMQMSNEQNKKIDNRVVSNKEDVVQETARTAAETTSSSVVGKELSAAGVDADAIISQAAVFASNEVGTTLAPLNTTPTSENSPADQ